MTQTLPEDLGRGGEAAPRPRRHFSEVLRSLSSSTAPRILFSDLLEAFGDRAFGALLLLFSAPNLLPLPPGSSTVLGAPLIIIAAQLTIGRRVLWLPEFISKRSLAMADFKRFADLALPWIERAERFLKPRLTYFFGLLGDRIIGIVCLLLGIILILPIPLGNMMPAMAVAAFALGLIERDGVAVLMGWLLTAISLILIALVFSALVVAVRAFINALAGFAT